MNEVLNSGENPWELFIEKAEDGGRFILGNIQVNPILLQEPSLLSFKIFVGRHAHDLLSCGIRGLYRDLLTFIDFRKYSGESDSASRAEPFEL